MSCTGKPVHRPKTMGFAGRVSGAKQRNRMTLDGTQVRCAIAQTINIHLHFAH